MDELKRLLRQFSAKYGEKGKAAAADIERRIKAGEAADEAVAAALKSAGMEEWLTTSVSNLLITEAGTQLPAALKASITAEEILTMLSNPWDGSGMKLSEKLHGAEKEMRAAIVSAIKGQVKRNASITQLAAALYDGYKEEHIVRKQQLPQYLSELMTAYRRSRENLSVKELRELARQISQTERQWRRLVRDETTYNHYKTALGTLLAAIEKGKEKSLSNAIYAAVHEKGRYVAERIARTEGARAWYDAFTAKYDEDESVAAYRWKLGSRHPHYDICDLYAEADLYGLGTGVFPKDKAPQLPAHPHCLCHYSPVYKSELEGRTERDNIQKGGAEYIKKLTQTQKEKLLGVKGSLAYLRDNDWTKHARGWAWPKADVKSRIIMHTRGSFDIIEEIRKRIRSDEVVKEINRGQQEKHIQGTNNFNQEQQRYARLNLYGPSYLTISREAAQGLIRNYHGKGIILSKNGAWRNQEVIIDNNLIIGVVVNDLTGVSVPTTVFKIHYGKNGAHIVPDYPSKKGG